MNLNIGYIPYLNMVPFHQGFGPAPLDVDGRHITFRSVSPSTLGIEAEKGTLDAGAMSLVDTFRLASEFELIGNFGIGVKRAAQSVFVFSRLPLQELHGICGVSDETATSVKLLQVLLEQRFNNYQLHFGRIASAQLIDESLDAVLLIGDEALQAAKDKIRGFPVQTDLAEEWYRWQGTPFVFARWVARRKLPEGIKTFIAGNLERSLIQMQSSMSQLALQEARSNRLSAREIEAYWDGFVYRLAPSHEKSIERFEELSAKCLTA